jgi:hypothetical protein
MHVPRTARFDEEAERFALVFTCDDCGHFDVRSERCRHEWPTERHRASRYLAPPVAGDEVTFCKEFEVR